MKQGEGTTTGLETARHERRTQPESISGPRLLSIVTARDPMFGHEGVVSAFLRHQQENPNGASKRVVVRKPPKHMIVAE